MAISRKCCGFDVWCSYVGRTTLPVDVTIQGSFQLLVSFLVQFGQRRLSMPENCRIKYDVHMQAGYNQGKSSGR
jgi:hypothetical protein